MRNFGALGLRLASRLGWDSSGNVAVIAALGLLPIMSVVGLALDFHTAENRKADVQAALDMSVVNATKALQEGASFDEVRQALADSMAKITANQADGLSCRGSQPEISETKDKVYASYTCDQETSIGTMLGIKTIGFDVAARAVYRSVSDGCILALGPVAPEGVRVSGSARVNTDGCSVMSNVLGPDSVYVSGAAKLEASCVYAAGGIGDLSAITTTACIAPVPNDGRIRDPYEDIQITEDVASMKCEKPVKTSSGTYTLPAGRYCGADVKLMGDIQLEDGGVYYFDGADLEMRSSWSTLAGKDVTLVFMNDAEFSNANGGTVNLSAPTSGDWSGILMYGDRDTTSSGAYMKIAGNNYSTMTGALYFPKTDIEFRGTSDSADGCTQLVARSVDFGGDANLRSQCELAGVRQFGANKDIFIDL